MKKRIIIFFTILGIVIVAYNLGKRYNINFQYEVGQPIDSLNHVVVYYNGGVSNNSGRNTSEDNYNIGIKYQCVEFVKRYYFEHLKHKMPNAFGNAKDFFDEKIEDGELNEARDLFQYRNGSKYKPEPNDLIVFSGSVFNKYGHVAIISEVNGNEIEIVQQNPGPYGKSRETIKLNKDNNKWTVENDKTLGWLRKQ